MRRCVFEPLQPVEHFFDAADGERRNDQPSAAGRDVGDDARQSRAVIVGLVQAIAVGRFEQQDVRLGDRRRIRKHRPSVAAEIAAEQHRLAADGDARVRRPEQVARR